MIHNFDYYKQLESPDMFLCNPDLKPICVLNGQDRHLILRFNDLSELTFRIDKTDIVDEKDYDRIKSKRLIFISGIGWFQITNAQETIEGSSYYKEVTAESHQTLFKNRGFISEERAYMFYNENDPTDRLYDSTNKAAIPSVIGQLVQQCGLKLADNLSDITPEHDYKNWTVIYIDPILKFKAKSFSKMYESDSDANIVRYFTDNNTFAYDFIVNEVQSAFEVVFEFDILYHTIKIKTMDAIVKPTDIYLSFENILNKMTVEEDAEDITTVLTCEAGDLDITTVNPMGTNYIVDFSYYMQEVDENGNAYPWMSKALIDTLKEWESIWESKQEKYQEMVLSLQSKYLSQTELSEDIQFANLRVTDLKAAVDQYVSSDDVDRDKIAELSVTVEEVGVGERSLDDSSEFYESDFNADVIVTAYVSSPKPKYIEQDDIYTFEFSGKNKTGSATSMIADYIMPTEEETEPEGCYLYFSDGDELSYCKLTIASEVGVAKDLPPSESEDITPIATPISPNNGVGYVQLEDSVFKVVNQVGTIVVYDNKTEEKINAITGHSDYFDYNGMRHRVVLSADNYVTIYRYYVSGFERHTVYKNLTGENGWLSLWEKQAENLCAQNENIEKSIDEISEQIKEINEACNVQKYIKNKDEQLYDELFHYWIEGTYTNDNLSVDSNTTLADRIKLAKELMAAGEVELEKAAQPTFTMTADAINFISLLEFEEFTKQLSLGKVITIEKNDSIRYYPALTAIEYDIDKADSFSLTFSSSAKPNETAMTFADLIKEASDTTRTVASNWADLTDFSKNKDSITSLIDAPLDRALRAMQAGLSNQEFIIDETGILGRRYADDGQTSFANEQLRIINNLIAFTDDNWKTVKTALGKTDYGYGLVAEVIVGKLILGDKIAIGSNSERVTITDAGITIKNDDGVAVFDADRDGNLIVKGTIEATSGKFGKIKINEDGSIVSDNDNFMVTADGNLMAKGSGIIGGYNISDTSLTSGSVGMSSDTKTGSYAFWAGNTNPASAPFNVTNEGNVTATSGNIGNLSLGEGSLYSQNFRLETIRQTNSSKSWLKFYNDDGEETTSISDTDISTGNITADGSVYAGTVLTNTLSLNDGISLSGSIISGSVTSIQFDGSSETTSYKATLSYKGYANHLKVEINSPLRYAKSFTIKYKVVWGSSYGTATVNIAAGKTSGEIAVSAFWGISEAYFLDSGSETYMFTQSSGTSQIRTTGSLVPNSSSAYDLGSQDLKWKKLYTYVDDDGSDKKKKYDIRELSSEIACDLIYGLNPKMYKFKEFKTPRDRAGFIAQDVERLLETMGMTTEEWALVSKSKPNEPDGEDNVYSLNYKGFIAPIVKVIQTLNERISILEDR